MRLVILIFFILFFSMNIFSQKKDIQEIEIYKTYNDYLAHTSIKTICSVKKGMDKTVEFLKLKDIPDSIKTIWGIYYEDKVSILNSRKNKFYKLEQDSLGLYYDIFNNEDINWVSLVGATISGLATGTTLMVNQVPVSGVYDVTLRYRQNFITKEFNPYEFPKLKPSKVIYYFTKYSKNEALIKIEIDKIQISLIKGSYYEEIIPTRPPYSKKGFYFKENPIPFIINIYPTKTTVILFSRAKDGSITFDELNPNMVNDFLKKKEKLTRVF